MGGFPDGKYFDKIHASFHFSIPMDLGDRRALRPEHLDLLRCMCGRLTDVLRKQDTFQPNVGVSLLCRLLAVNRPLGDPADAMS